MTLGRLPTYPRSAYAPIQPRLQGVKRTYPSTRGWGSGWPDCQTDKLAKAFSTRPRDGQPFNRPFREELVKLVGYLMQSTMDLGYEFRRNDEPDGGVSTFNCRPIKGTTDKPSWHSWGMAIDINSAGNPMLLNNPNGWRSTQPPWMVDLWESSGFYWGGRYTAYADCMHFEYMFHPEDVATDQANAIAAFDRIARIRLHAYQEGNP